MAYRWFLGYGFHDKVRPTPRSEKIMLIFEMKK